MEYIIHTFHKIPWNTMECLTLENVVDLDKPQKPVEVLFREIP